MVCYLCQTYSLKLELIQEHVKTLEEKNLQLKRINDTLVKNLKNCSGNQDWKVKYQSLLESNYQTQKYLHQIQSKTNLQKPNILQNSQNNATKYKTRENLEKMETFRDKITFQTPKNKRSRLSSEKMSSFIRTMNKNISSSGKQNFKTQIKKKNLEKKIIINGESDIKSLCRFKNYFLDSQNFKNLSQKSTSLNKKNKVFNLFESSKKSKICQKPKTLIQILAFE